MYLNLVGKIIGMLLEIDNFELLYMLEFFESFRFKVSCFFDFGVFVYLVREDEGRFRILGSSREKGLLFYDFFGFRL